ncbi:tyrosine-type recombinase/integrase [Planctomycetales bacterium ZRK34]|nr:tyrosine-type recombinase/integrase [Planctomycetales bacterium ZRK34]
MGWRVFKKDKGRRKYTIEGRDHLDIRRRIPAFQDKALSHELARNVAKIVEFKSQNAALPPMLARWVQDLTPSIKHRLADIGLLDQWSRPISDHLADYEQSLAAKGNTDKHVTISISRISRIVKGCKFRYWSDVNGSKVQQFIASLGVTKKKPATAATQNYYLRDFKSFARWCVRDGRISESPIEHVRPLAAAKVRNDRRRERRAFSADEIRTLLYTTSTGPDRYGMSGVERAMLYRLAVETGLRASELRSLRRESLDLDDEAACVVVQGAYTKNREPALIPLRPELATELTDYLATKLPTAPAFNVPDPDRRLRAFKADLRAAGIPYEIDGKVADFHALRHTTGTWLAASGVHPKLIQRIMRHSTITLTLDRYTHAFKSDEAEAITKLPELSTSTGAAMQATGTDPQGTVGDASERGALRDNSGGKRWTERPGSVDSTSPTTTPDAESGISDCVGSDDESSGELVGVGIDSETSAFSGHTDFESAASANSATPAGFVEIIAFGGGDQSCGWNLSGFIWRV